jgi:hypothetical protein
MFSNLRRQKPYTHPQLDSYWTLILWLRSTAGWQILTLRSGQDFANLTSAK